MSTTLVTKHDEEEPEGRQLWARLQDKYWSQLVRHAGRFAPSGQAEDAVQDVLLRAVSEPERIKREYRADRGSVMGFVHGLLRSRVRNRGLDLRRNAARLSTVSLDEALALAPEVGEARVLDELERRELYGRVRATLSTMPKMTEQVILLREEEGLTFVEIAQCLDSTPDAVRVRYRRAMVALRRAHVEDAAEDHGGEHP